MSALCFVTRVSVLALAKTVPEITYNVFSGTLNPTHSLTHSLALVTCLWYVVVVHGKSRVLFCC